MLRSLCIVPTSKFPSSYLNRGTLFFSSQHSLTSYKMRHSKLSQTLVQLFSTFHVFLTVNSNLFIYLYIPVIFFTHIIVCILPFLPHFVPVVCMAAWLLQPFTLSCVVSPIGWRSVTRLAKKRISLPQWQVETNSLGQEHTSPARVQRVSLAVARSRSSHCSAWWKVVIFVWWVYTALSKMDCFHRCQRW